MLFRSATTDSPRACAARACRPWPAAKSSTREPGASQRSPRITQVDGVPEACAAPDTAGVTDTGSLATREAEGARRTESDRSSPPSPATRKATPRLASDSVKTQAHHFAHVAHGFLGELARPVAAVSDDVAQQTRIIEIRLGPLEKALLLIQHRIDDRLLALEAADARRRASALHPLTRGIVGVDDMQLDRKSTRLNSSH